MKSESANKAFSVAMSLYANAFNLVRKFVK